jgi:hypothetical protein
MKYRCTFCARVFSHLLRCETCGILVCDSCTKGGRSSNLGVAARAAAGYLTAGLSEVARLGYRKLKQHCPSCGDDQLTRV